MLKGTNRNFFSIFDYTTYQYDPDGSQTRRKLYTGAGLQLDEQFEYSSWRGLSWKYTRTDPNLLSGSDTWEYRYRYNAMGEREQKRETLNPAGDGTAANGYSWTYYLLGGTRAQLSVWEGLQTSDATFCSLPGGGGSYVHFYPSEYLTYGGSSASVVNKPTATSAVTQEYRIADHLGSNRAILNNSGTVTTTTDYKPFGEVLTGSGESRKSFIDKERDEENSLGNFGVRAYDYDDGRFTNIDPLWEIYRAISPYQYGFNNPSRLQDPSGFVVAWESGWTQAQIQRMIDYYNSDPLLKAMWNKMVSSKKTFLMGRRGSAIEKSVAYEQFGLSEKQVSEKVGTVTWPMSREQGHLDDCGDPNEGSDIYIAWETNAWTDPIGKTGIPSLFQEGGLSPINKVLIGHETFHALRLSLGIEIGLREGYHRSFSEFAAVVVENFIRESEGLPTRNSYGGVPFEENAQLNLIVLLQSIGLNVPKKETKKEE